MRAAAGSGVSSAARRNAAGSDTPWRRASSTSASSSITAPSPRSTMWRTACTGPAPVRRCIARSWSTVTSSSRICSRRSDSSRSIRPRTRATPTTAPATASPSAASAECRANTPRPSPAIAPISVPAATRARWSSGVVARSPARRRARRRSSSLRRSSRRPAAATSARHGAANTASNADGGTPHPAGDAAPGPDAGRRGVLAQPGTEARRGREDEGHHPGPDEPHAHAQEHERGAHRAAPRDRPCLRTRASS